jgi:hypothetical protein
MEEILDEVRWNRLFLRKTESEISKIFEVYRSIGVEPILIKGWAAARSYPEGVPRNFTDIDLAIPSTDFDKCLERNRTEQLTSLNIDLHRELRHLDQTPWIELFDRTRTVELDGTQIRILAPEDHLRVICTHWLTDGGQYRERLWDIYYAVENRPDDFDWDLCLNSVSNTRRNWVVTAVAIAKKYLGLQTQDLPFNAELGEYPRWIDRALENEWKSDIRLRPIETCLGDRRELLRQIRRRIPPNPIRSTIECEAMFDNSSRLSLQLKTIALRVGPSVTKVGRTLLNRR